MLEEKEKIVYSSLQESVDTVDFVPEKVSFTRWDLIIYAVSVIIYIFDVVTDVWLAYYYYKQGSIAYFSLTLCFVVIPTLIVTIISWKMYWDDWKMENRLDMTTLEWIAAIILHVLQLAPVMRYFMTMRFGRNSSVDIENKRRHYRKMLMEASNVAFLRLIDVFLESAPQLVIQLYIIARTSQVIRWDQETASIAGVPHDYISKEVPDFPLDKHKLYEDGETGLKLIVILQVASILTSLISLAWTITAYKRNIRLSSDFKMNFSLCACICHFLWHLFTIAYRVLALALFSSIFSFWILISSCIRWIVMTAWILSLKKILMDNRCFDFLLKGVIGFIYLYSFIDVVDEPTKFKYIFFYSYDFIENCIYFSLWFHFGDRHIWFYYPALVIFWGTFLIGIIFMYVYHDVFHPTKKFRMFTSTKSSEKDNSKSTNTYLFHKEPEETVEIQLEQISKPNFNEVYSYS